MMLPIKAVLGKTMSEMGYTARIRATSAMLVWNDEIAPSLAVASRATFVRGKTLYVTVEKPVWAQQLSMMKRGLVRRINASSGKDAIRDIRFRSGQVRAPLVWGDDSETGVDFHVPSAQEEGVPDWSEVSPDENDIAVAEDIAGRIIDPDIRTKFRDLMLTDAKWRTWARHNLSPTAVAVAEILRREPWLSDTYLTGMVSAASSDDLIRARDAAACELKSEIAALVALEEAQARITSEGREWQSTRGDSNRRVKIKLLVESLAMLVSGQPPEKVDEELIEHALGTDYASYVRYVQEGL